MKHSQLSLAVLLLSFATTVFAFDYQHIRNATVKITYGGKTFLVDPYLASKGAYAGFEGTVNSDKRNPLIDMKPSAQDVVKGVDAVIVTHTHDDHWDKAAQDMLPKNLPVFVQNAGDAKIIRSQGFSDVRVVGKNTDFHGVKLSRTSGQHGTDAMYAVPQLAEMAGDAMGVVFRHDAEKTLYIAGDTLWTYHVDHALQTYRPDVIVLNTGEAKLQGFDGAIIMGKDDVKTAAEKAPDAQIITVHMDAVNHATVSSDDMRAFVQSNRLDKQVSVPKEGDTLKY